MTGNGNSYQFELTDELIRQEQVSNLIKSDKITKAINREKQNRHIQGSSEYCPGRSYLLNGIDPQKLIDMFHGTGESKFTNKGKWKSKEVIHTNNLVGILVNSSTSEETYTSSFTIHYSKTGTHIVPAPKRRC